MSDKSDDWLFGVGAGGIGGGADVGGVGATPGPDNLTNGHPGPTTTRLIAGVEVCDNSLGAVGSALPLPRKLALADGRIFSGFDDGPEGI